MSTRENIRLFARAPLVCGFLLGWWTVKEYLSKIIVHILSLALMKKKC